MKKQTRYWAAALVTMTALALGAAIPAGWAHADGKNGRQQEKPTVVELGDARLKFEINSTDEDGGIQVFLDADPWKWMMIFDPSGRLIFRSTARGSIGKQGGTELFLKVASRSLANSRLRNCWSFFQREIIDS